jgi:hypothetical protein
MMTTHLRPSKPKRLSLGRALIVSSTMFMAASAWAWGTIEGQVLDEETNQPIPGAIAVVFWQAS